jgi:hypothetical protein
MCPSKRVSESNPERSCRDLRSYRIPERNIIRVRHPTRGRPNPTGAAREAYTFTEAPFAEVTLGMAGRDANYGDTPVNTRLVHTPHIDGDSFPKTGISARVKILSIWIAAPR